MLQICAGCDFPDHVQDEGSLYELPDPVGRVWLCLECGPEENRKNPRRQS